MHDFLSFFFGVYGFSWSYDRPITGSSYLPINNIVNREMMTNQAMVHLCHLYTSAASEGEKNADSLCEKEKGRSHPAESSFGKKKKK